MVDLEATVLERYPRVLQRRSCGRFFLHDPKQESQQTSAVYVCLLVCVNRLSERLAVLPHTALQSVGSYGVDETNMGIIQAREPMIRKEGVRPPLIACEALSIPSVPFQKHPAQPPTDHSIVGLEDVPKTVPKVVEPPLRRASEPVENYRQRVARFLRRQLADAGDELSVALRSWKPQPASERIAQKRKALLPRVHDVCFLGMQCQPIGLHPPAHLGQRRFGFFQRATQDDKSSRPEEPPLEALTEPDVNVSAHPALLI